jgi:hypothetical protein
MPAIFKAWNWIVPPDININQSSPMQIDRPEPQVPDMKIGKTASKADNRLTASL